MIFCPDRTKPYQQPAAQSFHEVMRLRASTHSDAVAITAPCRPPLTYSRLLRHVEDTVGALRSFGIGRNHRVAVVLPNGPEMATAFLAVGAAATCAPLNPAYRDTEFDFYLSDLKARAVVIAAGLQSPARAVADRLGIPVVELQPLAHEPAGIFNLALTNGRLAPSRDDIAAVDDTALVLHTSGTTSRPKIVPLTHSNICCNAHNIMLTLALSDRDRCLNVMPLFHIHGLVAAVAASITAGASVVCTNGFEAGQFFKYLEDFAPTWYTAVPTMHQAILGRAPGHDAVLTAQSLRFIRSSSASLPPPVLAQLEDAFGTRVVEAYGMTEASHQMTSNPLAPLPRKPGSVGVPAGPDVAIMDDAGNVLPQGAVGEVVIRGPNVTASYENNPAANQSSFTQGWFRTGDQGRFDEDGYLYLTGRLKEMINRGGEKVAPREVDEVLLMHPAVAQAVAFAVPHPTLGEDVAAAVVLKDVVDEAELTQFAAARLADFKVPREFLILDELPKGPTGKLQRIGLADVLGDRLAAKRQDRFVAAETPVEQRLAEIWRDVLKVDTVGVRDNFYALGGDSLATVVMLTAVEEHFHTSVSIEAFLRAPTIETVTGLIAQTRSGQGADVAPTESVVTVRGVVDSPFRGLRNRALQILALYAPGYTSTRVWLHRMRGATIGRNVSIGLSTLIETAYPELVIIGDNVTIGMRVVVIAHLRDSTAQARAERRHTVRIEKDAYIGPGVIILPNVTIGEGAVVSAGSVVHRSVPAHTLVRGNPAVPIARCGVSLGGGVSYEEFLRHLTPIGDSAP